MAAADTTSHRLIALALQRPVSCVMLLITILVTGAIAYQRIPVQLMPAGFSPPFMGVWIPYRDATPQEVERTIARPVEDMLNTVPKLITVRTNCSSNGCWIFLGFHSDTDMDAAYLEVADRMERVRASLPADQDRYFLWKYNPGDEPVVWLGIAYPEDREDPFYPIAHRIQQELERIPGVARVNLEGLFERAIRIDVNPERVRAHHIDMVKLAQELQTSSFTLPSGKVEDGGMRLALRSLGRFQNLEELADLPVGPNLRLRDIAEVKYAFSLQDRLTRINGRPAVQAEIFKESSANAVQVCDRIAEVVERELPGDPDLQGYHYHILFDQGRWIRQSIDTLRSSAIQGGALAVLILLVFLRSLRVTLVVALAIPCSILMTLVVIYFQGGSFNLISMMGLTLGVGMLVDNSIVVVENIEQKRQSGLPILEAARTGAGEVALAILLSTLTTLVVFLPLMLMQDDAQFSFFMRELASPVCWTLLASLFVALVFVPLAIVGLGGVPAPDARLLTSVIDGYARTLRWMLTRRTDAALLVVALIASCAFPFSRLREVDRIDSEPGAIRVNVRMPAHFSMSDAGAAIARIEAAAQTHREELQVRDVFASYRQTHGNVMLMLRDPDQWVLRMDEVIDRLKRALPVIPGVETRVNWRESESGSGSLSLRVYGPDSETLMQLGEDLGRELRNVAGVVDVETELERGADEVQVTVNRELAQALGVESSAVAGTLQYALRGNRLPDFLAGDRQVPVIMQFFPDDVTSLDVLRNIGVRGPDGRDTTVGTVSSFRMTRGLGRIQRENRRTVMTLKMFTREADMAAFERDVRARLARCNLPRGYSWDMGERFDKMQQQAASFLFAVGLACVFVFLLMGVLFESFVLPFSVVVSIPFAFFGVYWLLWLTDTPMDVMSLIGVVILVGVVVNNAIVLVDAINRLRLDGHTREDAIATAGRSRFRAIWMTALTTIVGLVPMAFGSSNIVGVPYYPLGRTIMGGLLASTVLSLYVVPLCYTFFDDLRMWGMRTLAGLAGARPDRA